MLRVTVLLCVIALVHGRIAIGKCPSVTPKSDMDYNAFRGSWTEVSRYFSLDQGLSVCTFYFFNLLNTDTTLAISRTAIGRFDEEVLNDDLSYTIGSATSGLVTSETLGDLVILDTDNTDYAVLYTCQSMNSILIPFRREFLFVLSRNSNGFMTQASLNAVHATISANGLRRLPLIPTSQNDCPGK